jgi:hypothetical protein
MQRFCHSNAIAQLASLDQSRLDAFNGGSNFAAGSTQNAESVLALRKLALVFDLQSELYGHFAILSCFAHVAIGCGCKSKATQRFNL